MINIQKLAEEAEANMESLIQFQLNKVLEINEPIVDIDRIKALSKKVLANSNEMLRLYSLNDNKPAAEWKEIG